MNTNENRLRLDTYYGRRQDALREHFRIISRGGKAYVRRYKDLYRLRVQKNPAWHSLGVW
jgi:hypothetical protein